MLEYLQMTSCVYLSKATSPFSEEQLIELTEQSAQNNHGFGITGFLCYDHQTHHFLQYIEGRNAQLIQLMRNITADHRHTILRALEEDRVKYRRFNDWGMKSLNSKDLREMGLENILTNVMQLQVPPTSEKGFLDTLVWDIVNNITLLKARLN